jgi:hypothetical protein
MLALLTSARNATAFGWRRLVRAASTMRAIVVEEVGGPDVLKYVTDCPEPELAPGAPLRGDDRQCRQHWRRRQTHDTKKLGLLIMTIAFSVDFCTLVTVNVVQKLRPLLLCTHSHGAPSVPLPPRHLESTQ